MPRLSAGLLMYRIKKGAIQVLLAHPGGPFFSNKDDGAWSIPKGEPDAGEDLLVTAQREFQEETGLKPAGPFVPLNPIQQKGGKIVHAWAFAGDCDPSTLKSNTEQHFCDGVAAEIRPGRIRGTGFQDSGFGGIRGTQTDYGCLSNFNRRPGFRGRRIRPISRSNGRVWGEFGVRAHLALQQDFRLLATRRCIDSFASIAIAGSCLGKVLL